MAAQAELDAGRPHPPVFRWTRKQHLKARAELPYFAPSMLLPGTKSSTTRAPSESEPAWPGPPPAQPLPLQQSPSLCWSSARCTSCPYHTTDSCSWRPAIWLGHPRSLPLPLLCRGKGHPPPPNLIWTFLSPTQALSVQLFLSFLNFMVSLYWLNPTNKNNN